jgi:carbamoyl-phosphate synthase large subunit
VATRGTWRALVDGGLPCDPINKVTEGRPHIVDMIKNEEIQFIINTTEGRQAIHDSYSIRREALQHKVNYSTTVAGARAILNALEHVGRTKVNTLQALHEELRT